jgi:parallel beta-helix repeat protein
MISTISRRNLFSIYLVITLLTTGFVGFLVYEGAMDKEGAEAGVILYVGSGQTYSRIQDAIDNASVNDTVRVYAGTYYENVVLDKPIDLIGNGSADTIIDGGRIDDVIYVSADWVKISGFKMTNSSSSWGASGIELNNARNCYIYNNNVSSNKGWGIFLYSDTSSNTLENNTVNSNGGHGIRLYLSEGSNTLVNNKINSNPDYGIYIDHSSNNTIVNNTSSNNWGGIHLYRSSDITFMKNIFINNVYGISMENSSNRNALMNNICSNNINGIYFDSSSSNNVIINSSTFSNSGYDIKLSDSSVNSVINTTFSTISIDPTSRLVVKNYLHIQVNDNDYYGAPVKDSDIEVKDNNIIIYATAGFGGTNSKTDKNGQAKWILTVDRIYIGSSTATDNDTEVEVSYPGLNFRDNNRKVNMFNSHFEYFYPNNSIPFKINLKDPVNNSFVNDSTPELNWETGIDSENDLLSYYLEVDEYGGDWSTLIDSYHTPPDILSWNATVALIDGEHYQWRVLANDGSENGSWSDVWRFTLDTSVQAPVDVIAEPGSWNNTNSFSVNWTDPADTSGIVTGAYYKLDSQPTSAENGTWVDTKPITGINVTGDGVHTIYVWLKDKAGNIDHTKNSSTLIYVDTARPLANKPTAPGDYNNTGTVNWSWEPFLGTASGISGYYVSVGTFPGGNDTVKDVWTTDTWYEQTGLEDGKTYYCKIKMKNGAGTIGSYGENSSGILIDKISPTNLSVSVNNETEYTKSLKVNLSIGAEDNGSGLYLMAFSTNGISWSDWENYTARKSYSLSPGEGEKIINYKVKDKAGNVAEPVLDTIILDTSKPRSLSISINDGTLQTNSTNVTLKLSAIDDNSGLNQMSFSTDGSTWDNWEAYNSTKPYKLIEGDGIKTVFFKVSDKAGNIAEPVVSEIILKSTPSNLDSDGDGYPDDEDAFPNDPTKWEKTAASQEVKFSTYIIVAVIVIVIIIVILLFVFLKKSRIGRERDGETLVEPEEDMASPEPVGQTDESNAEGEEETEE